ncbi:hypothetical protein BpHYR1_036694 [Brachionus plicatilis]|uniref:Uncharacterized protein n=1 Tax=Brachionus plicatilis TaxID=10195 RepID=A0A3M7QU73_BRAPC|nr:hypothetical protein BpHYR1_036694 [Brachionus plicatilis]
MTETMTTIFSEQKSNDFKLYFLAQEFPNEYIYLQNVGFLLPNSNQVLMRSLQKSESLMKNSYHRKLAPRVDLILATYVHCDSNWLMNIKRVLNQGMLNTQLHCLGKDKTNK